MGSLSRSRDFALLVLTGVSRAVIARIVVFESLMYALSSFLLALGVMAVVGFSVSSRFPAETKVTAHLAGMWRRYQQGAPGLSYASPTLRLY